MAPLQAHIRQVSPAGDEVNGEGAGRTRDERKGESRKMTSGGETRKTNHCRRVTDARLECRRILPDRTVFEPTVVAVPDVDFEEEDDDDEDDEEDDVEAPMPEPDRDDSVSGAMLPGPGVGERRVQDPGRSAPIQGTRCRSRQQSSRLLIPVMPVMLTGALLRMRCCHAGTSCGRHCPQISSALYSKWAMSGWHRRWVRL